jgi:hypothetical protein
MRKSHRKARSLGQCAVVLRERERKSQETGAECEVERTERAADGVITGDCWDVATMAGPGSWWCYCPRDLQLYLHLKMSKPLARPRYCIRLQSISYTPFDFKSNRNIKNVAHIHITQLCPPPIRCSPLHLWKCLPC